MTTKKQEATVEPAVVEAPEKETTQKKPAAKPAVKTITFKVQKGKNFVGFLHPDTRRFFAANDNGEFVVSEEDVKALEILKKAADVFEV